MTNDCAYLERTLRYLCKASRVSGSEWNRIVGQFIRDEFAGFGFVTEVHESQFTGWELRGAPPHFRYLAPDRPALGACLPVVWSGSTSGVVRGVVRRGIPRCIKTFEAYEWQVLPVVSADERVVACLLGGALAWPQPRDDHADTMPYLMVSPADWAFLRGRRNLEVELAVESRYVPGATLRNVIASKRGARPSILLTAHYDSFFSTTGFHDNASGIAALLLLARRLGPDERIAFVAFDAEEWNKLGSYRFVEEWPGLDAIELVVNIDSVGVGDGIYVAASSNSSVVAPEVQSLDGMAQFDTWPFMRKGIPAVQIGSEGRRPFEHWHQLGDNISLLSPRTFELIEEALDMTERLI